MMKRIGFFPLLLLCLNICACSAIEEATIIRGSLIIPAAITRPADQALSSETEEDADLPEDIEEQDDASTARERQLYSTYSEQLGMEFDGTESKALLAAIREWIGTRYLMGGCSKSGVDCSCFVKAIYRKAYDTELGRSSENMFGDDLASVRLDDLKEGDLLFFKTKGGRISHVGIYLKNNKFVHVSRLKGVKISSLDYFRKILFSARRPKVEFRMISKMLMENKGSLRE